MRFLKTALLGGAVGGVLSAIPLVNALNCCFCLWNLVGVFLGLSMYFKENPQERITNTDAAIAGAMSGVVAGFLAAVLGLVINLILGSILASMYSNLPHEMRRILAQSAAGGAFSIVLSPLFYGGWGALGGFLAMELFHKDRRLA
jgi:hypothetical protein